MPKSTTDLKATKTKWADARADHGAQVAGAAVQVVLRGLQAALVALIDAQRSGSVLVACAWFTSGPLLAALQRAQRRGVLVLVLLQKERWLQRPRSAWHRALIAQYTALGTHATLPLFGGAACLRDVEAVRCVGKLAVRQDAARMHNKFVVLCDAQGAAQAVWTGSANFSAAAEDSFENAVVIREPTCAAAYLAEFRTLLLLSEPLSSTSRTMRPTYK